MYSYHTGKWNGNVFIYRTGIRDGTRQELVYLRETIYIRTHTGLGCDQFGNLFFLKGKMGTGSVYYREYLGT